MTMFPEGMSPIGQPSGQVSVGLHGSPTPMNLRVVALPGGVKAMRPSIIRPPGRTPSLSDWWTLGSSTRAGAPAYHRPSVPSTEKSLALKGMLPLVLAISTSSTTPTCPGDAAGWGDRSTIVALRPGPAKDLTASDGYVVFVTVTGEASPAAGDTTGAPPPIAVSAGAGFRHDACANCDANADADQAELSGDAEGLAWLLQAAKSGRRSAPASPKQRREATGTLGVALVRLIRGLSANAGPS